MGGRVVGVRYVDGVGGSNVKTEVLTLDVDVLKSLLSSTLRSSHELTFFGATLDTNLMMMYSATMPPRPDWLNKERLHARQSSPSTCASFTH